MKNKYCVFCGRELRDMGNSATPIYSELPDRCCDICNERIVIPVRIYFDKAIRTLSQNWNEGAKLWRDQLLSKFKHRRDILSQVPGVKEYLEEIHYEK